MPRNIFSDMHVIVFDCQTRQMFSIFLFRWITTYCLLRRINSLVQRYECSGKLSNMGDGHLVK